MSGEDMIASEDKGENNKRSCDVEYKRRIGGGG